MAAIFFPLNFDFVFEYVDKEKCYLKVVVTYCYVQIKIIQASILRGSIFISVLQLINQIMMMNYCHFTFLPLVRDISVGNSSILGEPPLQRRQKVCPRFSQWIGCTPLKYWPRGLFRLRLLYATQAMWNGWKYKREGKKGALYNWESILFLSFGNACVF